MISHTRQEWFELAVRGLAKQGWERSLDIRGDCRLDSGDGRACALGHGIPSEDRERLENHGSCAHDLVEDELIDVADSGDDMGAPFLSEMQRAHDNTSVPANMRSAFLTFAQTHNLTWPADVAREGEIK